MAENLVENYGYAALFFGTFVEGEMILVLGAVAANLGYLKLHWVIGWAFAGTLIADQLYFYIGRYKGRSLLCRRPHWQARADRVLGQLHRYHVGFMLGFRFFYGLRTVTPFVIGMLPVSAGRFFFYNAAGALVWVLVVTLLGYFFGSALEALFGRVKHYEVGLMAGIVVTAAVLGAALIYLRRRTESRRR